MLKNVLMWKKKLLVVLSLSTPLLPMQLEASEWNGSVENITRDIIQPGYQTLNSAFGDLATKVETFCAQPNDQTYQRARAAWRNAMLSWMNVSWIQFGPISSGTGRFDIQIWPVRKGITHKTVQSLLKRSDLDSISIEQAGVSIRGLTGSEYLLFSGSGGLLEHYQSGSRVSELKPFESKVSEFSVTNRCLILSEAVSNARKTSERLADSWIVDNAIQPYHQGMDLLDQADPEGSAASILWNALLAEVEFIQLRKLEGPLNLHGKKARATYAESWRSLHSFLNIGHQLKVLKGIYISGFSAKIRQTDEGLNQQVLEQFDRAHSELQSYPEPMKLMLKTEDGREKVMVLHTLMSDLYTLLREEVTPLTGFVLGFNANDGD